MNHTRQTADDILGVLSTIGWLSEQPAEFRDAIARAGRWTVVAKGARLYTVGDDAVAMFGLGDGLLDVATPFSEDEEVTVHRAPLGF